MVWKNGLRLASFASRIGPIAVLALFLSGFSASAAAQDSCFDYYDPIGCIDGGCFWCESFGVCLRTANPDLCDCHYYTDSESCATPPFCQWCSDLTPQICKFDYESCDCGNGDVDPGEDCDGTPHCNPSNCMCEDYFISIDGLCEPFCGDGVMVEGEQCEWVTGLPVPDCDPLTCQCNPGYIPDPDDPPYCKAVGDDDDDDTTDDDTTDDDTTDDDTTDDDSTDDDSTGDDTADDDSTDDDTTDDDTTDDDTTDDDDDEDDATDDDNDVGDDDGESDGNDDDADRSSGDDDDDAGCGC